MLCYASTVRASLNDVPVLGVLRSSRLCLISADYLRAEGHKSKVRKLEALQTEGDADDSDAPDYSENSKFKRNGEAAKDEPNNIGDGVGAEMRHCFLAEWPKSQLCKLEALQTEGDTDDGDAPHQAKQKVGDR